MLAAKKFLQAEVDKNSWEALDKSIRCLFKDEWVFLNVKGKDIGQTTILKFLGGNWKQWMIQAGLPSPQAYFPTSPVGIGKVRRSVKVFFRKDLTNAAGRGKV